MEARVHALMQDANDLHNIGLKGTIEEHVHRLGDLRLAAFLAAMAYVEPTNAWKQVSMIRSQRPCRLFGDTAHCSREKSPIPNASLRTVQVCASPKDCSDISLGWIGKLIPHHVVSPNRLGGRAFGKRV